MLKVDSFLSLHLDTIQVKDLGNRACHFAWNPGRMKGRDEIDQPGDGEARVAAGIDASKGLQIEIDIQRDAVEAAAVAHAKSDGRDLGAVDIDAGGIRAGDGRDTVSGE